MNISRANEILHQTHANIPVYYNGNSVWINSVNIEKNTVNVKDMRSDNSMNVNAKDLSEM